MPTMAEIRRNQMEAAKAALAQGNTTNVSNQNRAGVTTSTSPTRVSTGGQSLLVGMTDQNATAASNPNFQSANQLAGQDQAARIGDTITNGVRVSGPIGGQGGAPSVYNPGPQTPNPPVPPPPGGPTVAGNTAAPPPAYGPFDATNPNSSLFTEQQQSMWDDLYGRHQAGFEDVENKARFDMSNALRRAGEMSAGAGLAATGGGAQSGMAQAALYGAQQGRDARMKHQAQGLELRHAQLQQAAQEARKRGDFKRAEALEDAAFLNQLSLQEAMGSGVPEAPGVDDLADPKLSLADQANRMKNTTAGMTPEQKEAFSKEQAQGHQEIISKATNSFSQEESGKYNTPRIAGVGEGWRSVATDHATNSDWYTNAHGDYYVRGPDDGSGKVTYHKIPPEYVPAVVKDPGSRRDEMYPGDTYEGFFG